MESEQRRAVVDEAMSWVGTTYHHMGRVKGPTGGVDCAMLLAEVYERAGVISHVAVENYPRDWHLHRRDERFLGYILPRAVEIFGEPKPGDVVTWHIGHGFAHAAIIVDPGWPAIVHSDMASGTVIRSNGTKGRHAIARDGTLRKTRFFTLWPGHVA